MEFESAQSSTTAKLPILKLENGNSWVSVPQTAQENGTSVTKMSVPVTAKEKTNKKNDVKARSLLLMALPNEHQLTFSQYTDAKTMFATIETRFRESLDSIFNRLQKIVSRLAILGVVITQKDLNLKFLRSLPPEWNTHVVVWMNKAEIKTISIDDLYNNFKIIEQSVKKSIGASSVSTVSSNVNTAGPQVSTTSFSDNAVYAFMVENPNGSNLLQQYLEQIHEDDLEAMDLNWRLSLLRMRAKRYFQRTGKKIFINANDTDGYDKSKVECFNCHKMGHFARECRAPRSKEDQFKNQDNTRKQGNNEDTSSKAMLAIDGVGFDWSDMAEEQVQTNMALMAFSDSEVYNDKTCSKTCLKNYETLMKQCDDLIIKLNQTEFTATTYKRVLATLEEQLITYRKNEVLLSEEVAVLKREVACKDYEINVLKSEFEKVKQEKEGIEFKIEKFDKALKDLDKLLESQITDKSKKGLGHNAVPPPHPLIYNRPKKLDLSYSGLDEFKEPEFIGYGPKNDKLESNIVCDKKSDENTNDSLVKEQVSEDTSSFVKSPLNVDKETVFNAAKKVEFVKPKNNEKTVKKSVRYAEMYRSPRVLIMYMLSVNAIKGKGCFNENWPKTFNAARTVNTAHPKSIVFSAKPMPFNTAKAQAVNTARPKVVKTARPNSAVVNAVRVNLANAGKPQMNDKGFVDSGCSRHMTENIAYSPDSKKYLISYVTFGEGAHGGRITSKGTLKTDNLDFEDKDEESLVNESTDASYFDSPSKDVDNGEPKSAADDQKQIEDVNTGSFKLNIVDPSVSTASSNDQDSPKDMFKMGASHTLEATHVEFFSDEDEPEVDLGNITNSFTYFWETVYSHGNVRSKLWLPPLQLKLNMWLLLVAVDKYSGFKSFAEILDLLTKGFDAGRFRYLVSSAKIPYWDVDAQTRFETTSKQSNDPPLLRGYTLRSGRDNMKLLKLMELCTQTAECVE
ncbi:putative ribonuclease H-like domain-containing protein [Tanacetum coccineum]